MNLYNKSAEELELTTKYRIVLPRSITATKQQELKEDFDFFQLAGEQPTK